MQQELFDETLFDVICDDDHRVINLEALFLKYLKLSTVSNKSSYISNPYMRFIYLLARATDKSENKDFIWTLNFI